MDSLAIFQSSGLMMLKAGLLIFIFLYILFSIVLIRQVRAMTKAIKVGFERPIKLLAYVNLISSVLVFGFAAILL